MPLPPTNWELDFNFQDMQYLKGYYHKLLCSCKLQRWSDADDILSQVREKANKVNLERPIENPVAWAKVSGARIIFEQRRKERSQKKSYQKIECMLRSQIYGHPNKDLHFHPIWGDLLTSALNELKETKPKFYQLIVMRFFDELSWEKISLNLHPDIEITKTVIDRERKKGSRALKKLREIFFSKLEKL